MLRHNIGARCTPMVRPDYLQPQEEGKIITLHGGQTMLRYVMHVGRFLLLAALLSGTAGAPAWSRDGVLWHVDGRLLGKKGEKSKDVSGLACAEASGFPRHCVVIDDNLQAAQMLTVRDGKIKAGPAIPLIAASFDGKALELDGEGVAYADGVFYIIGSHGHPRDSKNELDPDKDHDQIVARIAAASQIARLRVLPGGQLQLMPPSRALPAIIGQFPALQEHAGKRLDVKGLTVEGVAVLGGRMFVGFRGPALDGGRTPVLSIALGGLFGGGAPDAKLFTFPVGTDMGVRDLAVYGGGLLVLVGPASDRLGAYALYAWDGRSANMQLIGDLSVLLPDMGKLKPEAILPLDATAAGLRVLVLFDGGDEGEPTEITVKNP